MPRELEFPRRADVVIVGGGVAGASLLYHLARDGGTTAVLLEQATLTAGSTWHAAGLCTQFNPSLNLMKLLSYSLDLYDALEAETGQVVGLRRVGSIRTARTRDGIDEFRARAGTAKVLGIPFEIVGPTDVATLFPLFDPRGVLGAAYLPGDGYVDPNGVAQALAKGARARGARVFEGTRVLSLASTDGRGWTVETNQGRIEADVVVNAAGIWAREVGEMAGVRLPLVALQHQYVITEPIADLVGAKQELPVLRDVERSFYARQDGTALLVGAFERAPLAWAVDGVPRGFSRRLLRPNVPQIADVLTAAEDVLPALSHAGIETVVHGPDAYTPDGRCLMGWVPEMRNLFVLAGFSIFGIVFGGGAGKYAAEWLLEGQPSDNMWELDVRRFGSYASARTYTQAKARQTYEREYAIHYPDEELPAARPLKTSPIHDVLRSRGAVFGERSGWERPLWFAPPGTEPREEPSFRRPNWLSQVVEECRRVRATVGVLDQTSFAKYEVSGSEAGAALDRMCANTLPAAPGRLALTQMLTPQGGIECDVTVTRLSDDRYYIVSAAATETHDLAWIESQLAGFDTGVRNVTARYGVLTLAGPRSRELLERLTSVDLANEAFPFFSARELDVAAVPVRALRLSYVGELGYELHHPVEYQRALYGSLAEAGEDLGLADFGYRALEAMRLEKGYRLWGADISPDYSPLEAGLERFVKFDKGDFVGREALLVQRRRGVARRLRCLVLDGSAPLPHGNEPIWDGVDVVAYVMSGGFGPSIEAPITYAYLAPPEIPAGAEFEIELVGERWPATVSEEPIYDPAHERLLAAS
jgi:dimethylglycine dehydrogenase